MRKEDEATFPLLAVHPSLLNIITLGHKNLYSDFAYFWLLQSLINDKYSSRDPDKLLNKINLVIRHHPNIDSLYSLSCFVMSLDYHRPGECEKILNEGMLALPQNWLLPALAGYMFAFVFHDNLKASYYYQKAAQIPTCPEYLRLLSKRLQNKSLDQPDAAKTLKAIIDGTEDNDYKEYIIKFLKERTNK